jgi:S1-C subfamily serine protease
LGFLLPSQLSATETSFSAVYQNDRPSVVYIVAALATGAASGTGFIYSSTGSSSTIITANHVVEGASRVDVILDSNPRERYRATIIRRDHVRDVAVLTIPAGNRKAIALLDAHKIQEGSDIAVIGYPRAVKRFEDLFGDDFRPSVHVGIVSAVRLNGEIVQFDAQIDHGDSGGPVIDKATGAVIGIVRGSLLDPSYAAQGLEQALPGSNFGMSVAAIDQVLNSQPSPAAASASSLETAPPASDNALSAAPSGSSAAYRVGYGAPHYDNPDVEATSQIILQRLSNYFANHNAFYMIPVQFGTASEEGQKLSGVCDDNRLNAIVQPGVFWTFPRIFVTTGAPASVAVKVTLLITDCSGGAFFHDVKSKTEDTRFSHRTVDREVVDMANDLLDQTLQDFEAFRSTNTAAWDSLLKTGIPYDPNDGRYHSLFYYNVTPDAHSYRVYAIVTNGPAAKGGLLVGDVIQSVNGKPVTGLPLDQFGNLFNSDTVELVVTRPGGQATLTIHPETYEQLLSSLAR